MSVAGLRYSPDRNSGGTHWETKSAMIGSFAEGEHQAKSKLPKSAPSSSPSSNKNAGQAHRAKQREAEGGVAPSIPTLETQPFGETNFHGARTRQGQEMPQNIDISAKNTNFLFVCLFLKITISSSSFNIKNLVQVFERSMFFKRDPKTIVEIKVL